MRDTVPSRCVLLLCLALSSDFASSACQTGWTAAKDGACFKAYTTAKTQTAAKASCAAVGGQLAKIYNRQEQSVALSLLPHSSFGVRLWIGGVNTSLGWKWSDNTSMNFTNWPKGDAKDPYNFGPLDSSYEYKYFSSRSTWTNAEAACVAWGGHLASIHSLAENNRVVQATGTAKPTSIWIGYHDRVTESAWQWSDGSEKTGVKYTSWAKGEPNDWANKEDCTQLYVGYGNLWNDLNCGSKQPFVCKKPKAASLLAVPRRDCSVMHGIHDWQQCQDATWYQVPCSDSRPYVCSDHTRLVPAAAKVPTGCPTGWTNSDGRCYKAYCDKLSWSDAEKTCVAAGGHLATITSCAQQTQARSLHRNAKSFWIGASEKREGVWSWPNGKPVRMRLWQKGEPNNHQGVDEKCALMGLFKQDDSLWYDAHCSCKAPFVCSRTAEGFHANAEPALHCATDWLDCKDAPYKKDRKRGSGMEGAWFGLFFWATVLITSTILGFYCCCHDTRKGCCPPRCLGCCTGGWCRCGEVEPIAPAMEMMQQPPNRVIEGVVVGMPPTQPGTSYPTGPSAVAPPIPVAATADTESAIFQQSTAKPY